MSPQRRTALVSVVAACVLIGLKLGTAIGTNSLGLLSEAAHSGTDLVAALLTFVAVGVSVRPADPGHAYGHGKAEHLAALAEAGILVVLSLAIAWRAVWRLTGLAHGQVDPKAYAFVVLGVVMAIDVSRAVVSHRTARRTGSPALQANALHFASDFAGSTAVLIGMILARHGEHWADSAAALFVAVLVLLAAARLMRVNVDVLMDRVPSEARGGGSAGHRRARAACRATPAADAPGGRAAVRGRGHRGLSRRCDRAGPCGRRRGRGRGPPGAPRQ